MAPSSELDPIGYESAVFQAGLHSAKPPFSFHPSDWEAQAKETLSANSWGYIHGNAGQGSTYRKNLAAFDRWSIQPQRLRPSRRDPDDNDREAYPDTSTSVLGTEIPFPIAIAPIGVQKIFHPQGEVAAARAAAALGVPYTLSTASSTSIEDVAQAMEDVKPGATRWFQLYWPPSPSHDDVTASLLRRAKTAGYTALIVTLDTYVLGWRPADMNHGYNPFLHPDRIGVEIGLTDPVFRARFKEEHGYDVDEVKGSSGEGKHESERVGGALGEAAAEWAKIAFPGHSHGWDDLPRLREHWDGPIVLKGIQTPADARRAVEAGVQGIVVSNHGGRQQDGGVSSLGALPRIVEAVRDSDIEVLFDSGVRCGADVLKALALGAKCAFIGRPYAYGLAIGGEDGVKHVLRSTCGDFMLNMHLAGLRGLNEVTRDVLVKEDELF